MAKLGGQEKADKSKWLAGLWGQRDERCRSRVMRSEEINGRMRNSENSQGDKKAT